MMSKKTYKLAIEALKKWRQKFAVDANIGRCDVPPLMPYPQRALKKYDELTIAIQELEQCNTLSDNNISCRDNT